MKFHMNMGTYRPVAPPGFGYKDQQMRGYRMLHFNTSPKTMLMMAAPDGSDAGAVMFRADALGNMEVDSPYYMNCFARLGWPIYDGPGTGPVTSDQLIWPDKVTELVLEQNPYERRLLEEIKRRSGNG